MIHVTEGSLIIEIPSNRPLETLSELNSGLLNLMACVNHKDAPKEYVSWGLHNLHHILQEMSLTSEQMETISKACQVPVQ